MTNKEKYTSEEILGATQQHLANLLMILIRKNIISMEELVQAQNTYYELANGSSNEEEFRNKIKDLLGG